MSLMAVMGRLTPQSLPMGVMEVGRMVQKFDGDWLAEGGDMRL
jgi:hypothetical protein